MSDQQDDRRYLYVRLPNGTEGKFRKREDSHKTLGSTTTGKEYFALVEKYGEIGLTLKALGYDDDTIENWGTLAVPEFPDSEPDERTTALMPPPIDDRDRRIVELTQRVDELTERVARLEQSKD